MSPRRWTIDDLVLAERAEDWTVSGDGRSTAWVRSTVEEVDGEERRVGHLWLSRLDPDTAEPRQLTRGRDRVSKPAFSPDGRHLAFLSDRKLPAELRSGGDDGDDDERRRQVWVLPLEGGEAFPVTRFDRTVKAFGWIGGAALAVLAPEAKAAWELEAKRRRDESHAVEDPERRPPLRLFQVDLEGEVRRLTANDDWPDALAVSPDGRRAVVRAQRSLSFEFDSKVPPETRLVDLETGGARVLFADPPGGRPLIPLEIRWAPDSSGFYFVDFYSSHPLYRAATVARLWHHDLGTGETAPVDLGWGPDQERGLGVGYDVLPDGFVALLADGLVDRLARYRRLTRSEWERTDLEFPDEGQVGSRHAGRLEHVVASPDGSSLLYQHSAATVPPQWFAARLDGGRLHGVRRLTDLNPGYEGKPTGRAEVVRWTGALGDEVEGLLLYPLDWPPDGSDAGGEAGPRPLVLDVHGGPASRDRDRWDHRWSVPSILLRQRGAFVLQANYHGSAGYGLEWVESIAGRYYELEIPDLEAGVDRVVERGLADPERLAVAGWSNGGILAAEFLTRTGRYRAASIGAADVEWISDWANVAFGAAFDNYYFGAAPWEAADRYVEKSPFFRLTEVTTPTIVHTGTEDTNVPPHQSWNLFRALQQIGKAPVRLVLYPGEPHVLQKIPHQRRKVREDLAWLDRYLFGEAGESAPDAGAGPDAVRPGSPIQALLQRARAARVAGGALGVDEGGVPVPETVHFERAHLGLRVGRFEVTRAQYAAFDPDVFAGGAPAVFPEGVPAVFPEGAPAPGEEDLPATGVPFERARAYAGWLAGLTGRPFRLPTEAEARRMAEEAGEVEGSAGNTLDRWAGYAPNPDDEEALLRAVEEAFGPERRAPLLQPVGSCPGVGEDPVFDLDGNAAEWAVAEDGTGVAVGRSADRSTGARGEGRTAGPDYTGFRVVEDEEERP